MFNARVETLDGLLTSDLIRENLSTTTTQVPSLTIHPFLFSFLCPTFTIWHSFHA